MSYDKEKLSDTDLHEAVKNGDRQSVIDLLNNNVDPSSRNEKGETPLHIAVSQYPCDYELVRLILNRGPYIDAKTRKGETPLHYVLLKDWPDYRVIKQLLTKGADPNSRNLKDNTPLHLAARNINASCYLIEELLKQGSDPNVKNKLKNTPLHLVARSCNSDVIRVLLEKGADPKTANRNGNSPLHMAASSERCNPDVVRRLVKGGADVNRKNKKGRTALHNFASTNSRALDTLKELFLQGSNVNSKDKNDNTPLHLAASNKKCSRDVIKELLSRGADVKAANAYKHTPLHTFAQCNLQSIDVLNELLIHYKNVINDGDSCGNTPLHLAVSNKYCTSDIIREMTKRGGNIKAMNARGRTPLHCFAESNLQSIDILRELLSHGDANAMDGVGKTPLHVAVSNVNCNRQTIKAFLEFGALINAKNAFGRTPLHEFSKLHVASCNVEVLKELLASGADHKVKDQNDFIALHYAAENKCMCVVKELIAAGSDVNAESRYRSPLHCSLSNPTAHDVIKLLLDEGAYEQELDFYGRTPLLSLLECHEWDLDIIELLLRWGLDSDSLINIAVPLRFASKLSSINHPQTIENIWFGDSELPDCCAVSAMIMKFALITEPAEDVKEVLEAENLCPALESYFNQCVSELDEIKALIVADDTSMYDLFVYTFHVLFIEKSKLDCIRALEMLSQSETKIKIYAQDIEYRLKNMFLKTYERECCNLGTKPISIIK